MTSRRSLAPSGYTAFLKDLKTRIRSAQVKAALAVNSELVPLYWRIGRDILGRQSKEGWGTQIIDRLGADLRSAFPEMQGFSPRNLKYMRALAAAWPKESIVQQVVALLPWGHNVRLLDPIKDEDRRLWHARRRPGIPWARARCASAAPADKRPSTTYAVTLPPPIPNYSSPSKGIGG